MILKSLLARERERTRNPRRLKEGFQGVDKKGQTTAAFEQAHCAFSQRKCSLVSEVLFYRQQSFLKNMAVNILVIDNIVNRCVYFCAVLVWCILNSYCKCFKCGILNLTLLYECINVNMCYLTFSHFAPYIPLKV